jgi:hypothetical protein
MISTFENELDLALSMMTDVYIARADQLQIAAAGTDSSAPLSLNALHTRMPSPVSENTEPQVQPGTEKRAESKKPEAVGFFDGWIATIRTFVGEKLWRRKIIRWAVYSMLGITGAVKRSAM